MARCAAFTAVQGLCVQELVPVHDRIGCSLGPIPLRWHCAPTTAETVDLVEAGAWEEGSLFWVMLIHKNLSFEFVRA